MLSELLPQAYAYPVTIVPDKHEAYVARIPDFPTVFTNGDTPQAALDNAYRAIALALDWYRTHGAEPPAPSAALDQAA
jgi:predicted RNase H-like HicB family nuclease